MDIGQYLRKGEEEGMTEADAEESAGMVVEAMEVKVEDMKL